MTDREALEYPESDDHAEFESDKIKAEAGGKFRMVKDEKLKKIEQVIGYLREISDSVETLEDAVYVARKALRELGKE